jgi:Raf kinase inhibitor-like YbhB/YbcL family protein
MRRQLVLASFVVAALVLSACGGDDDDDSSSGTAGTSTSGATSVSSTTPDRAGFTITSPAFTDGQPIPTEFTCDGENASPPLAWQDALDDTKQLALIVDDPDAPSGNFVHWVMWGFGPGDGQVAKGAIPSNAVEGKNGGGGEGYTGPCPPSGVHHYEFQLFALSDAPDVQAGATAQQLRDAIADITIAQVTLTGTYQRG